MIQHSAPGKECKFITATSVWKFHQLNSTYSFSWTMMWGMNESSVFSRSSVSVPEKIWALGCMIHTCSVQGVYHLPPIWPVINCLTLLSKESSPLKQDSNAYLQPFFVIVTFDGGYRVPGIEGLFSSLDFSLFFFLPSYSSFLWNLKVAAMKYACILALSGGSFSLQTAFKRDEWKVSQLLILIRWWKDWCWSSNTLATWCKELTDWKRPWWWERLMAGGEEDDSGWDGWMVYPTQWTWVWASSRSQWWTGEPGVL